MMQIINQEHPYLIKCHKYSDTKQIDQTDYELCFDTLKAHSCLHPNISLSLVSQTIVCEQRRDVFT